MARGSSNEVRLRIHERIRKRLSGSPARPRLAVFRSTKHIYAQIIDDSKGSTLIAASTLDVDAKKDLKHGGNIAAAKAPGAAFVAANIAFFAVFSALLVWGPRSAFAWSGVA